MKSTLIILIVLLSAFSGYWLARQHQPATLTPTQPSITPPTEPPPQNGSTSTEPASDTETNTTTSEAAIQEPIVIPIDQLPEGQQTLLRTLGIDGPNITFTPNMVTCAEAELGVARLEEIVNGDTPSFGEGVTVVSCYRAG